VAVFLLNAKLVFLLKIVLIVLWMNVAVGKQLILDLSFKSKGLKHFIDFLIPSISNSKLNDGFGYNLGRSSNTVLEVIT
jgi:hypothetical protein